MLYEWSLFISFLLSMFFTVHDVDWDWYLTLRDSPWCSFPSIWCFFIFWWCATLVLCKFVGSFKDLIKFKQWFTKFHISAWFFVKQLQYTSVTSNIKWFTSLNEASINKLINIIRKFGAEPQIPSIFLVQKRGSTNQRFLVGGFNPFETLVIMGIFPK